MQRTKTPPVIRKRQTRNIRLLAALLIGLFWTTAMQAHHGIASLGTIGLKGPGAPVDSSTSATLPEGSSLISFKLDRARYLTYSPARDDESDTADFFMGGYGYGWTPYLSTYAFLPYNVKRDENNRFNSAGFADLTLLGVLGFRYTDGFHLVPSSESLDEMEEWHFTVYGGLSLPTGKANTADAEENVDPGKSTGFGSPSYTVGFTATKMTGRLTLVQDISYLSFDPHTYGNGVRVRFGSEARYNIAVVWQTLKNDDKKFRLDTVFELSATMIAPDKERGVSTSDRIRQLAAIEGIALPQSNISPVNETTPPWLIASELAAAYAAVPEYDPWGTMASALGVTIDPSGAEVLYGLLGVRSYFDRMSFAIGLKTPLAARMTTVPLSRQLALAYLQGAQAGGDAQGYENMLSEYWSREVYKERQFQGSEGRENYRLIFTLSTMF